MPPDDKTEEFLLLFSQSQQQIHAYIRTMLFRPGDAEDVFQETSIALWRSFDQYRPGTSFIAWARQVAYHRVLAYGKKLKSDRHVFSADMVNQLANDMQRDNDLIERRRKALLTCLKRLPRVQRELLDRRYAKDITTVDLAHEMGRSLSTLYKSLRRIRRTLLNCIRLNLDAEEGAT